MLEPRRPPRPVRVEVERAIDRQDVAVALQRTFSSPAYRPPVLPAAAAELLQLSQRADLEFDEVVRLLGKDPVLAARVLSIAQSAVFAGRSPIATLHQAVVRLGARRMRDLVLEAALHLQVFRVPGFDAPVARLARHSVAVAHVMRAVCRRLGVDAEHAFLLGLLHDVGFAAGYLALSATPLEDGVSPADVSAVLDEVHEEASATLLGLWRIPEPIRAIVARHHDLAVDGRPERLVAALVVAEQLAWEAGAGIEPPPPDASPLSLETPEPPLGGLDVNWSGVVEEAARLLGLAPLALGAARAEAFELVRALDQGGGAARR
jgi:putative nucleotidyltransferase with HDIG domain